MAGRNTAVFGIYETGEAAQRAVDVLIRSGFASGDISVLLPDVHSAREFAHQKETKAPEGTTAGVTAGGVIGGAIGVMAGAGALAIPGLGPFIAAGPIVAGLAGLGVGGAVGGLVGALIGFGIPEYEAKRYEGRVRDGGTLLSVHCDSLARVKAAKSLLRHSGAQDIASAGESAAADPADLRADADQRGSTDPRVTRDARFAPAAQEPYVGDQSDPADPYHPRLHR